MDEQSEFDELLLPREWIENKLHETLLMSLVTSTSEENNPHHYHRRLFYYPRDSDNKHRIGIYILTSSLCIRQLCQLLKRNRL